MDDRYRYSERTVRKFERERDEWTDERGERQLERIYLDELPPDLGTYEAEPEAQCGIFCLLAESEMEHPND